MNRILLAFGLSLTAAQAHDIITTPITFDREIVRIFQSRCFSCHREGGAAFSLKTYSEARPWAVAIKEEVLARRMPPWGAVKGFGDFRNDQALTPEQLEVITSWADGGVPEGEEKDLPADAKLPPVPAIERRLGEIAINGDFQFTRDFTLDGLVPQKVPEKASIQLMAELPDGTLDPLIWLTDYQARFAHPFLLRTPRELPKGTVIRGVPAGVSLILQPPAPPAKPEHTE